MTLKLYLTTGIAKVFIPSMRFAELSSVFRIEDSYSPVTLLFFRSLLHVEFHYSHQRQDICTLLIVQGL